MFQHWFKQGVNSRVNHSVCDVFVGFRKKTVFFNIKKAEPSRFWGFYWVSPFRVLLGLLWIFLISTARCCQISIEGKNFK